MAQRRHDLCLSCNRNVNCACAALLAGGGLVFWHPNGARVRNVIETYWKDIHLDRGYQLVSCPLRHHVTNIVDWRA